jgi:hypothetical protein
MNTPTILPPGALTAERTRLLARIAEIDALLSEPESVTIDIEGRLAEGQRQAPEGYRLSHIQRPCGWTFKIEMSNGSWKSTGDDISRLIADAHEHAARTAARRAATPPHETQPTTAAPATPAPRATRRCAGCGVHIPEGQGMIASLGLSCDRCYDQLSD